MGWRSGRAAWLRTLYVLFFVELGSRRVLLAGVTANPDCAWMREQARNLAIDERLERVRFLVHDRDGRFSGKRPAIERHDRLGGLVHEYSRAA